MKKIFKFGKINAVEIEVCFTDGVFTACGDIWNIRHTDIVVGGQCLDEIKTFVHNKTFNRIYRLWKLYHLNDMHAGTKRQEQALRDKFGGVNANNYTEQCNYLKSIGLYEDNGYKFGTGWLKYEIPAEDIKEIEDLLNN